jgi:integrase
VWTPERIRRRETTGVVPSPVVVWTPAETGQFLDHILGDRLYALFHLVAHCGLRRGEACGLRWIDTDLSLDPDTATTIGTIHVLNQIVQLGWATDQSTPKTDESMATVALDPATTGELLEHRARQDSERRIVISSGDICTETGVVFTDFDGSELHAAAVTSRFRVLHTQAGLPPIRLHDLRHGAATTALAAGVDMTSCPRRPRRPPLILPSLSRVRPVEFVDRGLFSAQIWREAGWEHPFSKPGL